MDCDEKLQALIDGLDDPCEATDRTCQELIDYLLGEVVLNCDLDPSAYNACTRVLNDTIAGVCRNVQCDPNAILQTITDALDGAIDIAFATLCPNSSGSADRCYQEVIARVNAIVDSFCNDKVYGTQGTSECANMVVETAEIYTNALCNDDSSGTSGSAECVPMVEGIIDDAFDTLMRTLCPNSSGSADMCYQEIVARINGIVDTYCNDKVYGTQGANECANMAVETAESLINTLCNDDSTSTSGSAECAPMVEGIIHDAIDTLMTTLCPNSSGSADMCYQEVIARVNGIVDTYCNDKVYGTQGAAECANMVVDTAESLINTLCNDDSTSTSGSSECLPMVEDILQDAIDTLMTTLCPNSSGSADMCYQEVIARVNSIVDTYCNDEVYGTTGANECANMVAELVMRAVDAVCSDSESSSTGEDECLGMLYDVVCPDSPHGAADMCYAEIREQILGAVPSVPPTDVCTYLPVCVIPPVGSIAEYCAQNSQYCVPIVGDEVLIPTDGPGEESPGLLTPEPDSLDPAQEAEDEASIALGAGNVTSNWNWQYDSGVRRLQICVLTNTGVECETVGHARFTGRMNLNGRQHNYEQWSNGWNGSSIKATHRWNCVDDNGGFPNTSCSGGWQARQNAEYTPFVWKKPDADDHHGFSRDRGTYWYNFRWNVLLSGHPGHKWSWPNSGKYASDKFTCENRETNPCEFVDPTRN